MIEIYRLYIIAANSILSSAEQSAINWDIEGDGTGTFQTGQPLSNDGGVSHTHSACNVLESCVDLPVVFNALMNTPMLNAYGSDDRLGKGKVYKRNSGSPNNSGSWTQIGTGNIQTIALNDLGLDRYTTDDL